MPVRGCVIGRTVIVQRRSVSPSKTRTPVYSIRVCSFNARWSAPATTVRSSPSIRSRMLVDSRRRRTLSIRSAPPKLSIRQRCSSSRKLGGMNSSSSWS